MELFAQISNVIFTRQQRGELVAENKCINLRNVPHECHRQVKLAAADGEVTMEEWVLDAIVEKLALKEADDDEIR